MRPLSIPIIVVFLLAPVFSGCGNKKKGKKPSNPPKATATPTPGPDTPEESAPDETPPKQPALGTPRSQDGGVDAAAKRAQEDAAKKALLARIKAQKGTRVVSGGSGKGTPKKIPVPVPKIPTKSDPPDPKDIDRFFKNEWLPPKTGIFVVQTSKQSLRPVKVVTESGKEKTASGDKGVLHTDLASRKKSFGVILHFQRESLTPSDKPENLVVVTGLVPEAAKENDPLLKRNPKVKTISPKDLKKMKSIPVFWDRGTFLKTENSLDIGKSVDVVHLSPWKDTAIVTYAGNDLTQAQKTAEAIKDEKTLKEFIFLNRDLLPKKKPRL